MMKIVSVPDLWTGTDIRFGGNSAQSLLLCIYPFVIKSSYENFSYWYPKDITDGCCDERKCWPILA
jgi:hypothetical protein